MNKNYYQILGIERNASPEEIKKAYKVKARQTHPDVGGNEEEFKLVNEAYSVLSDQQKKNTYDNPNQFHHNHFEFDMNDFFGGFGFGFNMRQEEFENLDIQTSVNVSLSDIYQDKKATVNFTRNVPCGKCDGTGVEESEESVECLHCDGSGRKRRNGLLVECEYCQGHGSIHTAKCSSCKGEKLKPKNETLTVDNIFILGEEPRTLSYRFFGHFSKKNRGKRGNLIITLVPEVDERYTRIGTNLIYDMDIDYRTAITGGDIEYNHLDGKTYKIKVPEKSNKGSKFKLSGKGLLNRDKQTRGDLIINLSIIIDYSIEDKKDKKKKKK